MTKKRKHPRRYQHHYNPDFLPALRDCKSAAEKFGILALDIETAKHKDHLKHQSAGLVPSLSEIRLVQIAFEPTVYVFDMWKLTGRERRQLLGFIEANEFFAHYAQFEAAHFQHAGIHNLNVHCTQIMYRMLMRSTKVIPKNRKIGGSLQAVVQDILDVTLPKEQQVSDWRKDPLDPEQITYAANDAAYTYVLGGPFLKKIMRDMPKAYKLNKQMINPLARTSRVGFYFDAKAHTKQVRRWEIKEVKLKKRLLKRFGKVNFNSPQQLSILVENTFPDQLDTWPETASGKYYKTDKDTLAMRTSGHKGFQSVRKYKDFAKKISTYGDSLIDYVNPVTDRIHASYSLGYTDTDRLSSFQPNLQNLPRGKDVRQMFRAKYKKSVLIGADFSQIEAKIAALYSRDPEMLKIFREGKDLYAAVAAVVLRVPYEEIAKDSKERQIGKSLALGLLFGMGASRYQEYALSQFGVVLTTSEAKKLHAAFFFVFEVYREWQKEQSSIARKTWYAKTKLGMVRKLDNKNYYTCSMNTPIQGSAAEIIKRAFVRLDRVIYKKGYKARIVNCVHDEIDLEVFEEHVDDMVKHTRRCMVKGFKDIFPDTLGIKKLVDLKVGKTWADIK